MKPCQNCGRAITSTSRGAKYCGNACRTDAYRKRNGIAAPDFLQRKKKAFLSPDEEREVQRLHLEIQNYEKVMAPLEEEYGRWHQATLIYQTFSPDGYPLDRYGKAKVCELLKVKACPRLHEVERYTTDFGGKIHELEKELLTRQRRVVKILDGAKAREISKRTTRGTMTGADLVKMKFDTLPFSGQWLELIGLPARTFYAVVWGDAKAGKSYFSLSMAQYLTLYGKVAYVATEEGLSATMRQKVVDVKANDVSIIDTKELAEIAKQIVGADFVFIDSATKIDLTPEDASFLRTNYPNTAFIILLQSVKHGANFKGDQRWKHDADLVIEVERSTPQSSKASCTGRFGGGTIEINY